MIDEQVLIEMIKKHKELITCDNEHFNTVYGMAHDHIIELIKLLAKRTSKGADNEYT